MQPPKLTYEGQTTSNVSARAAGNVQSRITIPYYCAMAVRGFRQSNEAVDSSQFPFRPTPCLGAQWILR
jgi:hypothetical protein